MTTDDTFGQHLSAWLHEEAGHRVPDHLGEVLVHTVATRQRKWWSSPERWLPVDLTTRTGTYSVPHLGRLVLVALTIIAIAAAAIFVAGSRTPRIPPLFGLARNGVLVYEAGGDIMSYDLATDSSQALIRDPADDRDPRLSPDGTRILFDRSVVGPLSHQLMVADIDGKNARPLTGPVANVDSIAWSADSKRVSMSSDADSIAAVRIVALDGTLVRAISEDDASGHAAVEDVQWRPDGTELIFRGWTPGGRFGLYAIHPDGTGQRPIMETMDPAAEFGPPALSPDGSTIAFTVGNEGRIHLVDVDTGRERAVAFQGAYGGDSNPVWSPDGSKVLFQRADGSEAHLIVASVADGAVVQTGPAFEPGSVVVAAFSPDGTEVVAWFGADASTLLLDSAGGTGRRLPTDSRALAGWQRLAP
jgi:dipeptidyl aminopeptidase/acylaminoacyl peptidase